MKKNHFEKLIQEAARQVTLPEEKRAHMRSVLTEYVAFKPHMVTVAPTYGSLLMNALAVLSRPAFATIAVVLVIAVTSGGAAFAAEGTLPGDALYPLKVAIVEPVRTLLAPPETQVALHREFAERRIEEAATLANEGKLTASTEANLALNFSKNADSADQLTVSPKASAGSEPTDVSRARFVNRLTAYQNVLAHVDQVHGTHATLALQTSIRSHIGSSGEISAAPVAHETAMPTTAAFSATSADQNTVPSPARTLNAKKLQKATDSALRTSAEVVGSTAASLGSSTAAGARTQLERAESYATQGRHLLETNDAEGAAEAFTRSLSASDRLEVLTTSAAKLNINTFTTIISTTTTATTSSEETAQPSLQTSNEPNK